MKLNKSKKNIIAVIVVILVIIILAIAGVILYNHLKGEEPKRGNGVVGVITDGWDTGIEDEAPLESAGIQIPGYSTAEMKAGDTSLHLSIGNPEGNSCGFFATLLLSDGTVLYKSELLKPGFGLEDIPLSKSLESGEYDAVVCYECVTLDEANEPLNAAESEFKLIVK